MKKRSRCARCYNSIKLKRCGLYLNNSKEKPEITFNAINVHVTFFFVYDFSYLLKLKFEFIHFNPKIDSSFFFWMEWCRNQLIMYTIINRWIFHCALCWISYDLFSCQTFRICWELKVGIGFVLRLFHLIIKIYT